MSEDIFEIKITSLIHLKELDVTCFGVDKTINYMMVDIFQTFFPNNAVVINSSNEKSIFKIDKSRFPSFITKLAFCVTSDDNALMSNI